MVGNGRRAAVDWMAKRIAVLRGGIDGPVLMHSALAVASVELLVARIVHPDWIEGLVGFDPDHHSGVAEWALAAMIGMATLSLTLLARRRWQRVATAA